MSPAVESPPLTMLIFTNESLVVEWILFAKNIAETDADVVAQFFRGTDRVSRIGGVGLIGIVESAMMLPGSTSDVLEKLVADDEETDIALSCADGD